MICDVCKYDKRYILWLNGPHAGLAVCRLCAADLATKLQTLERRHIGRQAERLRSVSRLSS